MIESSEQVATDANFSLRILTPLVPVLVPVAYVKIGCESGALVFGVEEYVQHFL
jgi:hypothetical protein